MRSYKFTHCYIDESIHNSVGLVVTAFIFTNDTFSKDVTETLQKAGLNPPQDEFKSSSRMDTNEKMRKGRENLLALAGNKSKIAVFFGPFHRSHLGRQTFQALQSVLIRNAIQPESISVHFDEEIFPSQKEADCLHALFHSLKGCKIFACEDSRICVGIQVADAVAHSFGQIIKESLTDKRKMIDIGGPNTGYQEGTEAPLGWSLLMNLRYALFTRPVVYNGKPYPATSDPVIIDPMRDDPVDFGIHPILLGWGVQVAPEAGTELRQAVDKELGRLWLGCIH
jgi:hypothetical protein